MAKRKDKNLGNDKKLHKRPPVIAVLGHVDHGKTTLTDYIRKTQVAAGEVGGITQSIGAYRIERPAKITFIDTPGHEAFSTMRSRGAKVADIAVLVVAVDDSVMPQTKESVEYIKQAQIPLIVAINKMDLSDANAKKVKNDLLKIGVACEGYGGEVVAVEISAKTGAGVSELLEMINLVSEMENLTADPNGVLRGVVIESSLDRKRGPLATVLVKNGTLHLRDNIVAGETKARVKALFDEFGASVGKVQPSQPIVVLGFSDIPPIGAVVTNLHKDKYMKKTDEQTATFSLMRRLRRPHWSAEDRAIEQTLGKGKRDIIRLVVKAESNGALESVIENIPEELKIVVADVGDVTESDIYYAATTKAIVIGFKVKISSEVARIAANEEVVVRNYSVIYQLLEELDDVVTDLVQGPKEEIIGRAKVLQKFVINDQQIAGVRVEEGKFRIGDRIRVKRDTIVSQGKVVSIKRGKTDVKEAKQGEEYGLGLTAELDFDRKDTIIAYNIEK